MKKENKERKWGGKEKEGGCKEWEEEEEEARGAADHHFCITIYLCESVFLC